MRLNISRASAVAVLMVSLIPAAAAADPTADTLAFKSPPPVPALVGGFISGTRTDLGVPVNPASGVSGNLGVVQIPQPTSPPPLTGWFPSVGTTLLDDGIDVHGGIIDHFLAQTTAGIQPHNSSNLGVISPAVDLDLGKLLGVQGGHLHIVESIFYGKSGFPDDVLQLGGALTGYQGSPAPETTDLRELTYEQDLLKDRLEVEFGRTNLYHYFFLPNGLDPFTSESLTFYADADAVPLAHPVWGARTTFRLTPKWFLQGGAFEDNYIRSVDNSYNFGDDLASGAQILAELDYRSEFSNAEYPANLEVGAEYDTRTGKSNLKGFTVAYNPVLAAADYPGGGVLYVQGLQTVWRGPRNVGQPPRNIGIWGSLDVAVDKPQPFDLDALIGINFTGFLPGRPFDQLGLQAHYLRLSAVEANHETFAQDLVDGRGAPQSRDGLAFEVVHVTHVTRWLQINPYVEYFVNPDAYYDPYQARPHDGFMTGLLGIVSLGPLLGTSLKPF